MKTVLRLLALLLVWAAMLQAAAGRQSQPGSNMAGLPVYIERNAGQADARYQFVLKREGMNVGFRRDGIDFEVMGKSGKRVRFPLHFDHAAANLEGQDALPGKVNYLLGSDRSRWLRDVQTFSNIRYESLLKGVDLVFYGNPSEVEHDFILAPGADPGSIGLTLPPSAKLELSGGDAYLASEDAVLKFKRPFAYQDTPNGRKQVAAEFTLRQNRLGFEIGEYDHALPLVIDPALVFSTFAADANAPVTAVATDAGGNTYLVGYTFSDGAGSAGTFQPACASCPNKDDVLVLKLNPDGTSMVFATYLGGSENDTPVGIGVDSAGNVVIAGSTDSPNFPVKNGLPAGTPGYVSPLGFVTSLSPDGSALNYSTLLGHSKDGYAYSTNVNAFAMGPDGSAYVAGHTWDPDFPVTPGALNNTTPGYPVFPVFLTKLSPDGTLAFSGIIGNDDPQYGGGGMIGPAGMVVDAEGAVYMHGNAGILWPVTDGAYQTTIPGTEPYAAPFITKVAPDCSSLIYSTFLGPAAGAQPVAIAVTGSGEAWVTGGWAGSTFPITPDALYGSFSGYGAPYLSKLSADGKQLLYSTFLFGDDYGSGATTPVAVKLDGAGNVWLTGSTGNHNIPLIHPLQSTLPTDYFAQTGFVLEFNPAGKALLFSTYYGGSLGSQIGALAVDASNKAHLAGSTQQDLYTTPGAYRGAVTPPPPYYQYQYPFAAVIDPQADSPAICLSSPVEGVYFPATRVGTTAAKTATVKNCGTATLNLEAFDVTNSQFSIPADRNFCTATVPPDGTCNFDVLFTPTVDDTVGAYLKLVPREVAVPATIRLYGRGATPHASLFRTEISFPKLLVGTSSKNWTFVDNPGYIPLQIDVRNIKVTGDYSIDTTYCPSVINPGESCYINVTFTPLSAGERDGNITIPTDDPQNPTLTVTLNGSAVAAYPVAVLEKLDFGTAPIGGEASISAGVMGQGFFPESVVKINGVAQNTTYTSYTWLRFTIDPALLTSMGELDVTVTNPTPGGGDSNALKLTTYQKITGEFQHMVYNRKTNLLYVAVPANAKTDPNTILAIDPASGETMFRIPVGKDPHRLGLSSDGQYLFVGLDDDHTVQRINCYTHVLEKTYTLPTDGTFGGPDTASQIVGVPGSPKPFVVVLSATRSPSSDGVALYDDSGMVNRLPYDYPNWLEIGQVVFTNDPHTLYALPAEEFGTSFFKVITLDETGLHYTRPSGSYVGGASFGNTVVSDGTLLYAGSGAVYDPVTKTKVGAFTFPLWPYILPTPGRVFVLDEHDASPSQYQALSVGAYDKSSYSLVAKLYFDTTRTGFWPIDLVQWGTDGLAFVSGQDYDTYSYTSLNILRSSIVHGSLNNDHLAITSLSVSEAKINSPTLTIQVHGSAFRSDTAAAWNGSPLAAAFLSSTELTLTIPTTVLNQVGTATITLSNETSGGGTASTTFTVLGAAQLSFSPNPLDFGSVVVNASSAAKVVSVTNSGTQPITISKIAITGDFTQTNTCASSLAVNASCTASVVFAPTAAGSRTGSLTFTDDADGSPHSVALTGLGSEFSLGAGSGGSTSASVNAGQTATYNLALSSAGAFTGSISLACTGAPLYATCTVSPSSVNLAADANTAITVTVATSQSTRSAALHGFGGFLGTAVLACGAFLVFPVRRRKRLLHFVCAVVVTTAVFAGVAGLAGCGGGGSGGSTPPPPISHNVAPGTYTLHLTGTSGQVQKTIDLTLAVK